MLFGGFGIALVFYGMSEFSIYAKLHWVDTIYFSLAMIILMVCLFLASKILKHHPMLLFLFLVISFYLLIGHGFVIEEWQTRNEGTWVSAKSSTDLLQKIEQAQLKGVKVKAVKPISSHKILKEYSGAYHLHRTRESNQVDVWYYAAPYAEDKLLVKNEFKVWVICVSDEKHNSHSCFDEINTDTGGGYLVFSQYEITAVKNAIKSYNLNPIDKPIVLKWSQDIEKEIIEHVTFNNKIIKSILVVWMLISSLSFLFFQGRKKHNS